MSDNHIQHSFNSGEWSPTLNARVDMQKYHSGAALLRNFFVDYRGGASNRAGTRYVLKALQNDVRLIPFQASFTVSYVLEFTQNFVRFHTNGGNVLEAGSAITNITQANPAKVTAASIPAGYGNGNWVYISGVGGMTQVNGKYFIITNLVGLTFDLLDLFGNNVNSTGYGAYTSGGLQQKVYELQTGYLAADLPLLKYAQNVNQLILTHPNYPPKVLTLISANNWTIANITFGSTVTTPTPSSITSTLSAGNVHYSYRVTAVDQDGQESAPSSVFGIASLADIQTNLGSISLTWLAVTGAVSYNVYKARERVGTGVPGGAAYGFAGNCTGTTFIDTFPGIPPEFGQSMPIVQNPFTGSGVSSISLLTGGSGFTSVPLVTITGGGGTGATAVIQMQATGSALVSGGYGPIAPYAPGDQLLFPNGIIITALVCISGVILTYVVSNFGGLTTTIPTNPVAPIATSGSGLGALFNFSYSIGTIAVGNPGTGYGGVPAVNFSPNPGGAAATAVIGTSAKGNPAVPAFSQQRLILAAPPGAVNGFYGSQPGAPFNYNVSDPIQADDALYATITANQLNTIKSILGMPSGLIILTDTIIWQVNGGGPQTPFTAIETFANPQSYVGANDVPPIVANQEILFVQSKGSIIRDLSYNFYANVWTGTDISVFSSHLFYGFQVTGWCWAEEPYKIVWAARNDGTLLSLTFLKEQELIGWAHHDTPNGLFSSPCSVTETVNGNSVNAVYVAVQRVIDGNTVVYIERFAERYVTNITNGWFVDCGLQYSGAPATLISGLEHLIGQTVTGLADGVVIPDTVVSASGTITLANAASLVTVGLGYVSQLQTLALDIGEPTIQGKRKSISAVTVPVSLTLGLEIGGSEDTLVVMKDLVVGNLNVPGNYRVTDLVTGYARTLLEPDWTVPGQYFIQQSKPYPVSILGVIPEISVGDDGTKGGGR